jgi:adenylate kinase
VLPKPLRVVLLGPPASGKGTQGRRLATSLDLGYLSTGALLREQVTAGTDLGKQAEPLLARGEYLPDELICPILADWLSKQTKGWVLDGFPRSLTQAVFLDDWLARHSLVLDAAISLEVPYDELIVRMRDRVECPSCRWSGQRAQLLANDLCPSCHQPAGTRLDDTEENFKNRYAEFTSLTGPVIEHYRSLGTLCSCDGIAPPDEVAATLLTQLTALTD